jgi:orotate phosphoribosyltransferase
MLADKRRSAHSFNICSAALASGWLASNFGDYHAMTPFCVPLDKEMIAREVAKMLLEIKAVLFYQETPFFFTSGWASPVYIDCRKIISYPRLRSAIIEYSAATIVRDIGYESIDNIAGGETAGIPFAAWISNRLMLPMQYVRKKAKGFGRNAQIEGEVVAGARTLLVEDLATDGRSKVNFCQALRSAGADVNHCFVVFYYDIFPKSGELMRELGVQLHYLTTWWQVLEVAKESGHFEPRMLAEVENFLKEPAKWSAAHGGIAEFDRDKVT